MSSALRGYSLSFFHPLPASAALILMAWLASSPGGAAASDAEEHAASLTYAYSTYQQMGFHKGDLPGSWSWTEDGAQLKLVTPANMDLIATIGGGSPPEAHAVVWREGHAVTMEFPRRGSGTFKVNVFAKARGSAGNSYQGILAYELRVKEPEVAAPAPGQRTFPLDAFSAIDQHALAAPQDAGRTFDSLAAYLVKPAKTDVEKVRGIFRWITANISYDTDAFFSGNLRSAGSAESAFQARKGVCDGYAGIFVELARRAGIRARKVSGYAKGYGARPGDALPKGSNHAWVAVHLEDGWYLLDPTWGSGSVNGNRKFERKIEDGYFFIPPEQLIYTHLPEDSSWQLLSKPLPPEEFSKRVSLNPRFFKNGMEPTIPYHTIETSDAFTVDVRNPRHVAMMATLVGPGGSRTSLKPEVVDDRTVFQGRVSGPGSYELLMFAHDQGLTTPAGNYTSVATYRVLAR